MKANAREVETLLKGIISKKERAMKNGLGNDDLLGLLLETNTKESQESGSTKAMMSTEDIIGELKLFYFAGMETTAVLLTWTMVLLSMHPEWQDRAREEVLRIFGKNQPDSEGMNQLKTVSSEMPRHNILTFFSFQSHIYTKLQLMPFCVAGYNDITRGSKIVPAYTATWPGDISRNRAWRGQVPTWRCIFIANCVHPPQPGSLGRRCRRIQAREVRGGRLQGIQGRAGVLPVRLGVADMCWSELRITGGQDGLSHDPAALLVRALSVLHACTVRGLHSATTVWGADQA